MNLQGKRVLITGVGIKPAKFVLKILQTENPPILPNFHETIRNIKANVGAIALNLPKLEQLCIWFLVQKKT